MYLSRRSGGGARWDVTSKMYTRYTRVQKAYNIIIQTCTTISVPAAAVEGWQVQMPGGDCCGGMERVWLYVTVFAHKKKKGQSFSPPLYINWVDGLRAVYTTPLCSNGTTSPVREQNVQNIVTGQRSISTNLELTAMVWYVGIYFQRMPPPPRCIIFLILYYIRSARR